MAATYQLQNTLNQVIQTQVRDGSNFVTINVAGGSLIEVLVANVSPIMTSQITNGLLKIVATVDLPVPPPAPVGISADQKAGLDAASTALSGTNAVATAADLVPAAGPTANRPSVHVVGQQFFDTTLGKPIFWQGTKWVDAVGADLA